jgi:hypothetical protein
MENLRFLRFKQKKWSGLMVLWFGFFQGIKTGGWFSDSEIMKESEPTWFFEDSNNLTTPEERQSIIARQVLHTLGNNCHFASCAH